MKRMYTEEEIKQIAESVEKRISVIAELHQGGLTGTGLPSPKETHRLVSDFIPTNGAAHITVVVKSTKKIKYAISYYKNNTDSTERFATAGGWKYVNNTYTFAPETKYFKFILASDPDSVMNPIDVELIYTLTKDKKPENNVSVIGPDLILRRNSLMKQFGTGSIQGHQSFCLYNNKFYSLDGNNHIYVQDKNTYALEQTKDLIVGHGNGFQLGNSHYAYASGWKDRNLYKVDLDTLTIAKTYNLPTLQYSNALYDENRDLIYIFQRETSPINEGVYEFVVYDPNKSAIVSTTKLGIPYGAMQAADLYDDKIFVCAGLGIDHATAPNKYMVFDTTGHLLSRLYIDKTTEPEGIAIDRNDKKLYMSFIDKKVYTITD